MDERLIALAAVLVVCGIGLGGLLRDRLLIKDRIEFASNYLEKLGQYAASEGRDVNAYIYLTERSNRMQMQLGGGGVFAAYRPPYANFQYKNYPVLLNMLPELRNAFDDEVLAGSRLARQYIMTLHDVLVRHMGSLRDLDMDLLRSLRNPVIWLREGIRILVAMPIYLLGWLGALSESMVSRLSGSLVIKAVSSLVAVAYIISAVITIGLGWTEFVKLVQATWVRVFYKPL